MEKIIHPGKNCLYSALENVLRFDGMNISEEEIFLYCRGMQFQLHKAKNIQSQYIYSTFQRISDSFLDYPIAEAMVYSRSRDFKDIQREAQAGSWSIILSGRFQSLETSRNLVEFSADDMHCLILLDVLEQDNLLIGDCYVVNNDTSITANIKKMKVSEILDDIDEVLFVRSKKEYCYDKWINQAIRDNLEIFLRSSDTDTLYGQTALEVCVEELEKCTLVENQFLSQPFFYLAYMLKSHFAVIFDYWADILKRYLLNYVDSTSWIDEIKMLKERWNSIYVGLLKAAYVGNASPHLFQMIYTELYKQRSLFEKIYKNIGVNNENFLFPN